MTRMRTTPGCRCITATSLDEMVNEVMAHDLADARKSALLSRHRCQVAPNKE
jgi:hypothetical protein